MFDQAGDEAADQPVVTYNFFECWPSKWTVSDLQTTSGMVTETITLVCESIQRVSPLTRAGSLLEDGVGTDCEPVRFDLRR